MGMVEESAMDEVRECIALLSGGKVGEAKKLAQETIIALERQKATIEVQVKVLTDILNCASETSRLVPLQALGGSQQPKGRSERTAERLAVLDAAEEVAASNPNFQVTTDSVYNDLQQKRRPCPTKTGIGLILNKAEGWEKVDRGVYRKVHTVDDTPTDTMFKANNRNDFDDIDDLPF